MPAHEALQPLDGLQQVVTAYTGQQHRSFVLCSEVRNQDEWHLALALAPAQAPQTSPRWWYTQFEGSKDIHELLAVRLRCERGFILGE